MRSRPGFTPAPIERLRPKHMVRGFTMVEVIISIVIMSIIMYAVIAIYITSGFKGMNVESYSIAQSLAESKLEEVMAQDFVNITDEAETSFGGELSEYTYEIVVDSVEAGALDTPTANPSDYLKIKVMIRHPRLGNSIDLESIRVDL